MDNSIYFTENHGLMPLNLQFFADGPGGEKTEEPTAKKLSDAREEGQVAKSKDLTQAVSLFALFILLKVWTGFMAGELNNLFELIYNRIPEFCKIRGGQMEFHDYNVMINDILLKIIVLLLPFLVSGVLIAFITQVLQVKWKITTKPLRPKLSKLDPISGMKKLINVQSLVELGKSLIKLAVVGILIYRDLSEEAKIIFLIYDIPLVEAIITSGNILINIGFKITVVFLVVAFADLLFQKWKFKRDMRMTKQEVKEEYKNVEGDPQIKGKIRQKMQEASRRRMMQDLPKADVVITNPTHYAVAIVYDKDIAEAPVVLAKGADYLAQKIKEEARANNIAIVENKPLARSLYANVEVGQTVPHELYVAVAEVLAAVYKAEGRV